MLTCSYSEPCARRYVNVGNLVSSNTSDSQIDMYMVRGQCLQDPVPCAQPDPSMGECSDAGQCVQVGWGPRWL